VKTNYSFSFLLFLICFLLLCPRAGAVTVNEYNDVTYFSETASDGHCIPSIYILNCPKNSVQDITLEAEGLNYEICVESEKDLSTWYAWNFNVTLTNPDGEVVSQQVSKYALALSTYDIKIQYYYLDSSDINAYQLTLYIEVSPTLNAAFGAPYSDNSTYIPLAYSSISVSSSQKVDGKVYIATSEEFAKQKAQDEVYRYTEGLGRVFYWTWDMILDIVSKVPFIGSYLSVILEIAGAIIGEIIFYAKLFLWEYPLTILGVILDLVILHSISEGKAAHGRKHGYQASIKMVQVLISDIKKLIEFGVLVFSTLISIFTSLLSTIADFISSLKPT
jgi:hypothetical protein